MERAAANANTEVFDSTDGLQVETVATGEDHGILPRGDVAGHRAAQVLQMHASEVQKQHLKAHRHNTRQHASDVRTQHQFFSDVCDLSRDTIDRLFGQGHELRTCSPLAQHGQFSAEETISLIGPGSTISSATGEMA